MIEFLNLIAFLLFLHHAILYYLALLKSHQNYYIVNPNYDFVNHHTPKVILIDQNAYLAFKIFIIFNHESVLILTFSLPIFILNYSLLDDLSQKNIIQHLSNQYNRLLLFRFYLIHHLCFLMVILFLNNHFWQFLDQRPLIVDQFQIT